MSRRMKMTLDQILEIAVAAGPAIAAIIGSIVSHVKTVRKTTDNTDRVVKKFEEVRQEIFNTKEYTDLKDQLARVYQENIDLKRTINELLTKIDKVARKGDDQK